MVKLKHSLLLLGPRETGKNTLLRSLKPDLIINLSKEREYQDHLTQPQLIEDLIELKKPKLVFVDEVQQEALTRNLTGNHLGANCETIIYNQIKALLTYENKAFNISYFRTHSGIEIDFIVEIDKRVIAIEVKSSDKLSSDDVRHLKWLKQRLPTAQVAILHFGKKDFKVDGIWCFNWVTGLKKYFN